MLVRDNTPAYYVYRMVMQGRMQTGIAFAASIDAYASHRIRRHEHTRPDKENDRVRNIDSLNAQTRRCCSRTAQTSSSAGSCTQPRTARR